MRNTIKLLLILTLFIVVLFGVNYVFATEEDIDETVQEEIEEENVITEEASNQSTLSVLSPNTGTSVTSINSYEQANLKLSNVLSVILIAIGILLILFAIAILIRIGK